MSWESQLGAPRAVIFNKEIDEHFMEMGFTNGIMEPRHYISGSSYDDIVNKYDASLVLEKPSEGETGLNRIYMNTTEMFYEKETEYGSLIFGRHRVLESTPLDIHDVETALARLIGDW